MNPLRGSQFIANVTPPWQSIPTACYQNNYEPNFNCAFEKRIGGMNMNGDGSACSCASPIRRMGTGRTTSVRAVGSRSPSSRGVVCRRRPWAARSGCPSRPARAGDRWERGGPAVSVAPAGDSAPGGGRGLLRRRRQPLVLLLTVVLVLSLLLLFLFLLLLFHRGRRSSTRGSRARR